jgi:NADH-quinone oxidoreductase subunit A
MTDAALLADSGLALLLHAVIAVATVVAILAVAAWLREPGRDGFGIYESGAAPGAALRGMVAAPYFLVAVIFMLFDVEVAILFAWAVAAREVGVPGLVAASVFIALLLAALGWLWMDGALDTGPAPRPERGDGDDA